jgi:hypothetical protein
MKEMFPGPGPAGTVGLSHEVCCVIELSGQVWQVSAAAAAAAAAADWGGGCCGLRDVLARLCPPGSDGSACTTWHL